MEKQLKEQLIGHISDLDCQVECLTRAIKLELAEPDEEYRLNSLIVKRAESRRQLEQFENSHSVKDILNKLNYFPRRHKLICDYFKT